ncbi:hypothetical protein H8D36_03180 [archaeon]|nr:hypothetical protein [archaeon]MBL7057166.1 hypothetical protein [Candidatus Woesearchaeota archaeon]
MKKSLHSEPSHQLTVMLLVSLVAVISVLAASQDFSRNIGSQAVREPGIVCDSEDYCINWEWIDESDIVCVKSEFAEYKVCETYSWPVVEGVPTMQCDGWNIVYDDKCAEWKTEVSWVRECTEWRTKNNCYAVTE